MQTILQYIILYIYIYIKGRDKLPQFIIKSINQIDEVPKYSPAELVNSQYDRKDKTFNFAEDPDQVNFFKDSLPDSLISKLPLFLDVKPSSLEIISILPLIYSPMSTNLIIAVKSILSSLYT